MVILITIFKQYDKHNKHHDNDKHVNIIYMYICICIYIYIYVWVLSGRRGGFWERFFNPRVRLLRVDICIYVHLSLYICMYVYIYIYICTYIHMYIDTYITMPLSVSCGRLASLGCGSIS